MDMSSPIQDPSPEQETKVALCPPLSGNTLSPAPQIYVLSPLSRRSTLLPIQIQSPRTGAVASAQALVDSGATGMFVHPDFVQKHKLDTSRLGRSIPVYNVDGTLNETGLISEVVEVILRVGDHSERATLAVTGIGSSDIIVGHTWLQHHNPEIDWQLGKVEMTRCPSDCRVAKKAAANTRRRLAYRKRHPQSKTFAKDNNPEDLKLELGDSIFAIYFKAEQLDEKVRAASTPSQRLAQDAQPQTKEQSFEDLVPERFHSFRDVFSKESFNELPNRKVWDHAIDLKPDAKLPSSKLFPLSPPEQHELDAFLKENLANGRIQPSKSPVGAPVFFVKKKDGSLRLVQDYRKLNEITVKNSYPLPLISDVFERVKKARYFTKLDLRWGFNNVRIKEGDEWKAAFKTNRGLFEPLVMFFGLCNSPATFQTMMNDILRDFINRGVTLCYMDDILIFNEEKEEHRAVTMEILNTLRQHNLFLKPEKCEFEQERIEYLGMIFSGGKVEMDPVKVEGVRQWPIPKNVKELQSFLGFVNFYRRFVKDFSIIARPLHDLTRKDTPYEWSMAASQAFEKLKKIITSAPVLVFPTDNGQFRLEADASNYATGAILSQLQSDGKWHPVAFMSKSFTDAERNYEIYDKELCAIIRALEEWRHFLEGAKEKVQIFTDHRNLGYFQTAQNLNRRQARWSLFLSRFDYELHHRPGRLSGKPDALSRRPDHDQGKGDNRGVIMFKPEAFHISANSVNLAGIDAEIRRRVKLCTDIDEAVVKAVKELNNNTGTLHPGEWEQKGTFMLYRGRLYVPMDDRLRHDIVKAHHDSPLVGHPGRWKTTELVARNYWWPNMTRYIAQYVSTCDSCNRTKTFPTLPTGKLLPNRIPDRRWQIVTVDMITELPESQGWDSIMVVVDRLSKRIHAIPTTSKVDSLGVARLFRDNVWRHHGLPEIVISDRGSTFLSGFTRELYKLLGIKMAPSTANHPQTDGQTERVNQEIEHYLRVYVNTRQDDWAEWIPLAEFAYNNRIHSSTKQTPFELDTGQHPRIGLEQTFQSNNDAALDFATKVKKAEIEAKAALERAADDMARYYNRKVKDAPSYKVGDKVWLDAKHLKTDRPTKKLDDKWFGPFPIEKVVSRSAFRLKLPKTMKVHPVFNVSKLRPYIPDPVMHRHPKPPPPPTITEDGSKEFEVESIEDSRFRRNRLEYLVKWKGYPPSENLWLPIQDIHAPRLVDKFHRDHPEAPRQIATTLFNRLNFRPYDNLTEPNETVTAWWEGRTNSSRAEDVTT